VEDLIVFDLQVGYEELANLQIDLLAMSLLPNLQID
jgi:hypothetical protein